MGALRGLILDESLLFAEDEVGNNTHLVSGAASLLKRLRYSKLRVGICYQEDVSSQKMTFLTNTAMSYSFECIPWNTLCMDDTLNGLLLSWGNAEGFCIYATSRTDEELFVKLQNQGWKIILKSSEVGSRENKHILFIDKLEEFFIALCRSIKMTMHDFSVSVIGYVMKPSREEDFAKRGAFPMHPTQNGIIFVPLTFELPLAYQLQEVDAVLHKATDEIISIEPGTSLNFPKGITYSKGMQGLERFIQDHPEFCIIDPLYNIYPLLDRVRIQELLLGLEDLNLRNHCRIRAPNFLKIDTFHEPNLMEKLSEAKLSFPCIVKPLVACGVPDAHNMALVFKTEDFRNLSVPLPAIIQEYVDHGSVIFKIYVLGERVFHAIRKSMPNADVLLLSSERNGFAPIVFDSLKSLPTANVDHPSMGMSKASEQSLDMGLVNNAAYWLRRRLDLTIFGFDVVIQEGSGDHIIVDVNYLPSFKEVPDDEAMPAFWDAIKNSCQSRKKPK